jgi:hypothetical protein
MRKLACKDKKQCVWFCGYLICSISRSLGLNRLFPKKGLQLTLYNNDTQKYTESKNLC